MKYLLSFCAIIILFLITGCSASLMSNEYDLSKENWKFTQEGKTDTLTAFVPGTVQTDLLLNKAIPEPFFRTNENTLQWIGEKNWVYETYFNVSDEMFKRSNIDMVFEGLDTHAKVYLNETEILNADNFFRTWNADVKKLLKPEKNHLKIFFLSAVAYNKQRAKEEKINLGEEYVYTRKPSYHFGWDWGPVFITTGIWKPVILKAWDDVKIKDMQVYQKELTRDFARLEIIYEIEADAPGKINIETVCQAAQLKLYTNYLLDKGQNRVTISMTINNPTLWWPNGLGEHFLYDIKGELSNGNKSYGSIEKNIGLRTVKVIQKPDAIGKSFYFEINGVPVFMKGADYIPLDMFLSRPTEMDYNKIIDQAVAANMNMLRIWGGGFYENNLFYDLCDRKGLLVWQDFMFACAMYPGDDQFINNFKEEAIENIKRLRNHPSLAIWCGNNENYVGWKDWGWPKKYNKADSAKVWNDYVKVFNLLLPDLISKYDPDRFYWPSTPTSGWGYPVNVEGDVHYWGIWHAQEPFEEFTKEKNIGRFMSEYGFQGTPELNSIKKFTLPEDRSISSEVMKLHEKHHVGYPVIDKYIKWYYKWPKDFESYLLVSQLMQAQGIGLAIETHRAAMPFCMGTLYWQLNDLYPVTSWSSIDYYGNWKALHYLVRDLYKKTIIVPQTDKDKLYIKIATDELQSKNEVLKLELFDLEGNLLKSDSKNVEIAPNISKTYYEASLSDFLNSADKNKTLLYCTLTANGNVTAEKIFYFVFPKDLALSEPGISFTLEQKGDTYKINLNSKKLAKGVFLSFEDIDGVYSNNYFDMIPNRDYTIQFKPNNPVEITAGKLKIMSLFNTY